MAWNPFNGPLRVIVPWSTLAKIFAAVVLAWAIVGLWPLIRLLLLSILLAIALSPLVDRLGRLRLGRNRATALIALVILTLVAAFVFFVLPPLTGQLSELWKKLPELRNSLAAELEHGGLPARIVLPLFDLPRSPAVDAWLAKPLTWGPAAVAGLLRLLVVVVVSLYLLADGPKVTAWLMAYVPRIHRRKMSRMVPEVFAVVQAYTSGQLLVSSLFTVFAFSVLTSLGVPAALPLALFAGLCDAIPVAGIVLATAAAALFALLVSPSTALFVLLLFVAYHVFETYVLVPRVYGNRLRLSTLTVLLAILAGGTLGGVVGALLALPIVAAYPVVEKHWLNGHLHPDVVEDHSALQDAGDPGRQEAAVKAVLRGSPLPGG